jgi:uncharacterized membrane protein YphA (DoxX/SURF4 family)
VRWDVRFTDIERLPPSGPGAPERFRYATRLGFGLHVEGWGETVASKAGDGSALRFGSEDPKSLIREGAGTWTYAQEGERVRFRTVYDYRTRHGLPGRVVDRVLFRPLIQAATRWSFDRLRLWVERGLVPETTMRLWLLKRSLLLLLGAVWILSGLLPKIWMVRPSEVDLVRDSGLHLGSPALTLQILGLVEILAGLWLVSGVAERWSVALTTAGMLALGLLVSLLDPRALSDPYSGIVKNLGLLGCALAVLALSPLTPSARRGRPRSP